MVHKVSRTYSTRKKGPHKGIAFNRNTAPGAANTKTPKRYPTMKAAEKAAARISRLSAVRSKSSSKRKSARSQ